MTTSGVQIAGVRPSGTGSAGARTSGRGGVGGSSFADMVSSNLSAQKDAPSSQPKAERAEGQYDRTDAVAKDKPVSDGKEPVKAPEKEPAADVNAGAAAGGEEQNPTDAGMQDTAEEGTWEENGGLDTQFPKSLKLFKEAARFLEAQKLNELKQSVMDSLNIDEEELEKILEQLGVNIQALMQPQILQQVVVAVQGNGDPAVLLTNESAMNSLKELLAKVQELMADTPQTEAGADFPEGEEAVREVPAAASEFEEFLAKDDGQGRAVDAELAVKPDDSARGTADTDTRTDGKTDFTFEAVKEGAKAQGNPSENRGGQSSAKDAPGSMAEQFLDLVTNAASRDEAEFSQLPRSEQVREVAQQIIERVRVFVGEAQTSMEISLTPESLGRVTLNLVSRQGALTAHFTAQNQIAKEAIESQIVVLRENLESQGLKVEAIEVTVSNFDFTKDGGAAANGGGQENRHRGRRGVTLDEAVKAESVDGMREADEIAADMMERNGNQVDYTA